jgi:hypothetical protein
VLNAWAQSILAAELDEYTAVKPLLRSLMRTKSVTSDVGGSLDAQLHSLYNFSSTQHRIALNDLHVLCPVHRLYHLFRDPLYHPGPQLPWAEFCSARA